MSSIPQVTAALSMVQIQAVRMLLQEYWTSFGFSPEFQSFADEVAGLPGKYAPPAGRLALAAIGDEPAGCIALRPLDQTRGEVKRLFVRPAFRGRQVGRGLLDWVIAEAKSAGYAELLADTMPFMESALAMYERAGFKRISAYSREPTPGAVYLSLNL